MSHINWDDESCIVPCDSNTRMILICLKFICLLRVHTYAIFSSKAFLLSTRWPQPHVPYVHQVRLDDSIRKMEATQKRIFGLGPKQHALFYEGQVG